MTDKPILFSGPMVRAILEGRKTQTRRALKPQPIVDGNCVTSPANFTYCAKTAEAREQYLAAIAPYTPGDRLWVREAWQARGLNWGKKPRDMRPAYGNVHYAATDDGKWLTYWGAWNRSIHMPRWASRLTLAVTDVRVQRLQEISETDAIAEGIADGGCTECGGSSLAPEGCCYNPSPDFREGFAFLWDSLNYKRGYGWDANPWVCAVTFTVHRCNIDQMETL